MTKQKSCVPFGWKRLPSGRIVKCAAEQKALKCIEACRKHGMTYREIREVLRDAGILGVNVR